MEYNDSSSPDNFHFPEDTKENLNDINIQSDIENKKNIEKNYNKKNSLNNNKKHYFKNSINLDDLIDENEQSKDILLSFENSKNIFKEEDLISEKSKQNENIQYLKAKEWKYINKINYDDIEKKFGLIKNKLNKEEIKKLNNELKEKTIDSIYDINKVSNFKINEIQNFNNLIENYIKDKNFNNEKHELEKYIFKYRHIYKDNNNFYRCVIFAFLENIILTNNFMFLKELMIEIDEKISLNNDIIKNNDYLKNELELYIKINLINELLYILIKYMNKNINKSYETFIKIYLLYEDFDYGMIFIIRYLLYEYINENKYKTYSEENKIEISELLPSKYNKMYITTEKKFDLFYINELFRMKSYDCKMIYFLIPYFLDINLKIITYYKAAENSIYIKYYRNENDKFILELLAHKGDYDVCYEKKYYEFYSYILSIFESNQFFSNEKDLNINNNKEDNLKINDINIEIKEDLNKKYICENCSKVYKEKENILQLCPECLDEEFRNDILNLYSYYLQYVDHKYKNYSMQMDKYFGAIIERVKIKNVTISEAMADTGYLVYEVLNKVKKDICIICLNNTTKNYYFQLPCQCRLCSKKCFKKYFDIIIYKDFEKINKNDFKRQTFVFDSCICGEKYYYDDLLILYNYFKNKNKEKTCEMIIEIIKNRWKWKCIKCDKKFDPFCMNYRVYLSDPKINLDFYDKKLKHLICSECYDVISLNQIKNVNCKFCKSEHYIRDVKRLNYENKEGDMCSIF